MLSVEATDTGPGTDYPDPTAADLEEPQFNAVWEAIKGWDLERTPNAGYADATGNDVMHILIALGLRTS